MLVETCLKLNALIDHFVTFKTFDNQEVKAMQQRSSTLFSSKKKKIPSSSDHPDMFNPNRTPFQQISVDSSYCGLTTPDKINIIEQMVSFPYRFVYRSLLKYVN